MSKNVLKKIKVQTLPNGYALTIDDNEFMYFNETDLLAGFMARIGGGLTGEMEKGTILNNLFNIMLGERYAKDIDKLNNNVRRLESKFEQSYSKLLKEISIVDDAIKRHDSLTAQIKETTELTTQMKEKYKDACQPYKEYNRRLLALENDTMKMESHFKTAGSEAQKLLKEIESKLKELTKDEILLRDRAKTLVGRLELKEKAKSDDAEAETNTETDTSKVEEKNTDKIDEKPKKENGEAQEDWRRH